MPCCIHCSDTVLIIDRIFPSTALHLLILLGVSFSSLKMNRACYSGWAHFDSSTDSIFCFVFNFWNSSSLARIQAVDLKKPLLVRWEFTDARWSGRRNWQRRTVRTPNIVTPPPWKWCRLLSYIIATFSEIPPGGKCNRLEQFKFTPHGPSTGLAIGKLPQGCQLQMVGLPGPGSLKQIDCFWADPEL